MMQMTGAELILRLLERQGIETVCGIPGGAILPFYDALGQCDTIHHVLARHEQGGGFMAQGMARVSGKPEVCLASSGPGATNLVTAIADAKLDSIPMVAITGQVPLGMIGTDAFQEVDTYGMTIPLTKHNFLVRDANDLLEVIPEAFRIAMSGRPGPVLIDVPKDVQCQMVSFEDYPPVAVPNALPEVDLVAIEKAAEMINASERPVLYLGGGVIHSGASHLAVTLAEQGGLPTTMTLMALGTMPIDHPLSIGMLGMHGARYTNYVLEEADLLICVGARFDDRAIGKAAEFCPRAKIIHVDIDPAELHKIKTAHIGITGDVTQVVEALLPLVQVKLREPWLAQVADLKQRFPLAKPDLDNPRSHYGLVQAVADALDDEAVIATDVGQHQMWVAQAYPFRRPRQWLTSGGLGTMGFGLPTAIGAALAAPERTVVCFTGDGSLKMNIQEMATLAEEDLNVKIVLMNNNSLGLVYQQQSMFYGKRPVASKYKRAVNFLKIAEGFGLDAVDLDTAENPAATLAEALQRPGPCLIHCSIDREEFVYPMVPPGAANTEMIG
ncbi:acetolactate synthase large subunit [Denitromonas ohlonensis]|uniref:Acetolactate synthase n=2 Tax=Denitromonas TaxID=139331 RepID=A0A558EXL0_9RHOO|nr:acetolactate synthase large subunit [Denitromonas ohlonensis]TVT50334.1 MAG: acetolactate synthase large subunit [Denitromonas halophila]TVO69166.1 acetolactate synthase large subunit [Denitromonas ohlonensis]TVO77266.1 acetolactate synthase large subunit [Denitromonas ohlonensis]TVT75005.1 MAG: acetolactate synthase large subunit [Denitromonas halophila]TVT78111.1 MAG: acetolactate synthase large subunit [Denitromonas halophila]